MKRISLLLIVAALALAACAPGFAVARNLVNTAPAVGGANGTFSCYQLASTTYCASALALANATPVVAGFINPPAPALITLDPTSAPGGTDSTTITIAGTDYAGVERTDAYTWTTSGHAPTTGTIRFKTITSVTSTTTGSTYPGNTAVGYAAIDRFYVPANTQWVDLQWIGTTAICYVGFTSTAITFPLCAYVFPLKTVAGPQTRQMGLSGGTYLYFGVDTTANALDVMKIQCWK